MRAAAVPLVVLLLGLLVPLERPAAQALPAGAVASVAEAAASRTPLLRRVSRARPAGEQAYVYKGTEHGDNLWDIAGAVVGPPGAAEPIDRNQVMVAILRANPSAFPEGNLHRIQRGLDLTIPSRAEIRREDRAQAAALVAQHRKAYADRKLTPLPLYAFDGAAPASAPEAASAAKPAASAASSGEGVSSWWFFAGLVVVAGLGAVALRAWSTGPIGFDALALEPLPNDAPEPDAQAQGALDRERADLAVANLYQEDLSVPAPVAPEIPGVPVDALLPQDPAQAAGMAQALADAYQEVDRPQDAQTWRGRSS